MPFLILWNISKSVVSLTETCTWYIIIFHYCNIFQSCTIILSLDRPVWSFQNWEDRAETASSCAILRKIEYVMYQRQCEYRNICILFEKESEQMMLPSMSINTLFAQEIEQVLKWCSPLCLSTLCEQAHRITGPSLHRCWSVSFLLSTNDKHWSQLTSYSLNR